MRIKYKNKRGYVVFTPSSYDEYNYRRADGSFYDWQNALGAIADTLYGYPRAISVDRAIDCLKNTLDNLDDSDPRDWIDDELGHLEQIKLLLGSDCFFIQLQDSLYQDCDFVCAKNEEDACKKYLLSKYEDIILWVKDDYGDLLYGEDDEDIGEE